MSKDPNETAVPDTEKKYMEDFKRKFTREEEPHIMNEEVQRAIRIQGRYVIESFDIKFRSESDEAISHYNFYLPKFKFIKKVATFIARSANNTLLTYNKNRQSKRFKIILN